MPPISTRPFLKWLGSKYRIADTLLPLLPEGKRLIEPFLGSAAVFLSSHYPKFLLAEHNADLINLYQQLQSEGERFIQYAKRFFNEKNNDEQRYYQLRDEFNAQVAPRRRAALFLYFNRHGYNGLCRYNLSGGFNVPFGRYQSPYFPEKEMRLFHQKSQQCEFVQQDFALTLDCAKKGDVVYCDPPYVPLSNSANFTEYTHKQFGEAEQLYLAEQAVRLANKGIPVVISNHDTEFTRHHYRDATLHCIELKRTISCKGDQRGRLVKELIAVFR